VQSVFDRKLFNAMMKCQHHALFFVLAIVISLWNSDCLAQSDTSTTEGSCTAEYPEACNAEAKNDIETDANANVNANENENDGEGSDCQDDNPKCFDWAKRGECDNNPGYMLQGCRRSCIQCPDQADLLAKILEEKRKKIRVWAKDELEVAADMGKEQNLENIGFGVSVEQASARIIAAREHIQNEELDEGVKDICKNLDADCTAW
jgi:hypothetical protein